LFEKLERVPAHLRDTDAWKASVKALHLALGADGEDTWLAMCHVTCPDTEPARVGTEYFKRRWAKSREMRQELLAAIAERAGIH
jgi:hypothetical protein